MKKSLLAALAAATALGCVLPAMAESLITSDRVGPSDAPKKMVFRMTGDGRRHDVARALLEIAVPLGVDASRTDDLPGLGPHVRHDGGGVQRAGQRDPERGRVVAAGVAGRADDDLGHGDLPARPSSSAPAGLR